MQENCSMYRNEMILFVNLCSEYLIMAYIRDIHTNCIASGHTGYDFNDTVDISLLQP